jgi:hypothetical protein
LIGNSKKNLREAGPDSSILTAGERTEFEELQRSGTIAGIKANLDLIPLNRLALGNFLDGVEDDIFMEALVNNIKNRIGIFKKF